MHQRVKAGGRTGPQARTRTFGASQEAGPPQLSVSVEKVGPSGRAAEEVGMEKAPGPPATLTMVCACAVCVCVCVRGGVCVCLHVHLYVRTCVFIYVYA